MTFASGDIINQRRNEYVHLAALDEKLAAALKIAAAKLPDKVMFEERELSFATVWHLYILHNRQVVIDALWMSAETEEQRAGSNMRLMGMLPYIAELLGWEIFISKSSTNDNIGKKIWYEWLAIKDDDNYYLKWEWHQPHILQPSALTAINEAFYAIMQRVKP